MTAEESAQRIIDARGYLVMASAVPIVVGSVHTGIDMDGNDQGLENMDDAKVLVLSETDDADYVAQHSVVGLRPSIDCHPAYYYRVIAE